MPDHVKPIPRYVAMMRIIVSLLVLIVGLLVIVSPNPIFPEKFDDGTQKFAAGWIGAVIGYWLA